jgi:hypothetical protein
MATIDPDQERRRLAEFYSHQMDGELEKVAEQAFELTDLAREALRAELTKRGLSVELVELRPVPPAPVALPGDPPPPEPPEEEISLEEGELELRRMVTIRQFRDLPEALLAKGCLESAGIKGILTDDNIVRLDWFWSNVMGGIKLRVDPEDVEAASEILEQPIPAGFDVAGIGEYHQPHCPNCQSLDVTFKELNRPVSYMTVWLHVPIPVYRRAWRCHSCDVEWEDDGVPESPESPA